MLYVDRNAEPIPDRNYSVQRNKPGMSFYKKPEKPWGGCLPYVSVDCDRFDCSFLDGQVRWIDMSLCHACKRKENCKQRIQYLKALSDERKERALNKKPINQDED